MCVVTQQELEGWGGGKGESEGILGVVHAVCICIYPLNLLLWGHTYIVSCLSLVK